MSAREPGHRITAMGRKTATSADAAWELPFSAHAAKAARDLLKGWMTDAGIDPESDPAYWILLTASEAVGNAVLHGLPPVLLRVDQVGSTVTVSVADASPAYPDATVLPVLAEHGRGRKIAEAVTDWQEVSRDGNGKQVRFGVTVPGLGQAADAGRGGRCRGAFGINEGLPAETGTEALAS